MVSSATPIDDQERRATEANCLVPVREQDRRQRGDGREEQRAGKRQPRKDPVEESAVGRPGRMPGMKPPYFLQVVGLVDRVEGHRRVEVGEDHDEERLAEDIVPAVRAKEVARASCPGWFCPSWPIVSGIAITLAAKITGITPAMFTRSGR